MRALHGWGVLWAARAQPWLKIDLRHHMGMVVREVCEDVKKGVCVSVCLQGNVVFVRESQVCQIVDGQCCGDAGILKNEEMRGERWCVLGVRGGVYWGSLVGRLDVSMVRKCALRCVIAF